MRVIRTRLLRACAPLALCLPALGGVPPAAAQGASHGAQAPAIPAALACLSPPVAERGVPAYPEELLQAKVGGEVMVALRFDGPDSAPSVDFLEPRRELAFEQAVHAHVRKLRTPCLASGAPALRLTQTYAFLPHDGRKVTWSAPRDADEARQNQLTACTKHPGEDGFEYPSLALRDEEEGKVIVRMTFTGPDAAPTLELLMPAPHRRLTRDALEKAAGFRMPCHAGEPASVLRVFTYQLGGGQRRAVLRDMDLMAFLGSVRNVGDVPARFDLDMLGCPFDVRVAHLQPFARNRVGELGPPRAERRPLLEWLASLELRFPDRQLANAVYAERFTLNIPCGKIDL